MIKVRRIVPPARFCHRVHCSAPKGMKSPRAKVQLYVACKVELVAFTSYLVAADLQTITLTHIS